MDYIHDHASNSQSFGWRECVIVHQGEQGKPIGVGEFRQYWFRLGPFLFTYKEDSYTNYLINDENETEVSL